MKNGKRINTWMESGVTGVNDKMKNGEWNFLKERMKNELQKIVNNVRKDELENGINNEQNGMVKST